MTNLTFSKATKKRSKARVALDGPSGSGKTYSALVAAEVLAEGGRVAVIDTERGSASLYSDRFDFDVLELETFSPQNYIDAIEAAETAGYAVIVIDSLSHAWEGEGGALDMVDKAAKRSSSGNSYTAWKDVTPLQRKMVDAMLQAKSHVIVTMRSKMDYVQEKDERTGKTAIRKVGMAPIQRQGMEYEFTIVGDLDIDHNLCVSKSRCETLADAVVNKPDAKFFRKLLDWLNDGSARVTPPASASPALATPAVLSQRTPGDVKRLIDASAAQWAGRTISDGKRGLIAPVLETCFASGSAPSKRHQVQKYLTGCSSIREIPDPYLIALYTWLKPSQDNGGAWGPSAEAARDANTIISYLDSQPDQFALPLDTGDLSAIQAVDETNQTNPNQ